MSDNIRITGLEIHAHHGVLASEKSSGQIFVVDITIYLDLMSAAKTDQLEATADYGEVSQRVHDLVSGTSHDLIEAVAGEVAELVLGYPFVDSVEVTVHKPQAPISVPFADVSVTIRRP